jgi:hypothetical protein
MEVFILEDLISAYIRSLFLDEFLFLAPSFEGILLFFLLHP